MEFRHYNWIYVSADFSHNDRDSTGFPFPFKLSDISYDKTNPNITTRYVTGTDYSGLKTFACACSILDPITNQYTHIKSERSDSYYGYPYMITGTNVRGDSASTVIPSAFISGKYRFKTTVGWGSLYSTLGESTINVDVDINGSKVKAVILSGISARAWRYSNRFNNPLSSISPTTLSLGTYSIYNEPTQAPSDLNFSYIKVNTFEIADEYKNMVWDFGSIPQEVPETFKNWVELNADYIYPNSFTVKNSRGTEVLTEIIEAPTMLEGTVTYVGNSKTLNLLGSNGETYTLNWESDTPPNKIFTGLAFKPNWTVANLPVGNTVSFNLEGDIVFYEVYSVYKPPAETFSVTLYKNSAEANRVDKTDYLTAVDTLNGVMREGSSITDLSITFEMDTLPQFNYVYIPAFNRYYYVTDISTVKCRLWEMELSSDPLMTYKDAILSCKGFVDRNEFDYNNNIIDKKRVIEQGVDIDVIESSTDIFNPSYANNQNSTYWMRYVMNGYKLEASTYTVGEPPQE